MTKQFLLRSGQISVVAILICLVSVSIMAADEATNPFTADDVEQRLMKGTDVMISWSKDNDELRGFSHTTGKWTTLKIPKQENIVPSAGNSIIAVRIGNEVATYSGKTGQWTTLPLHDPVPEDPAYFNGTFTGDLLQIKSGDHLYTLTANKGLWTSPTDPEFQEGEKTIKLKHRRPDLREKLQAWIESFPKHDVHGSLTITNDVVRLNGSRQSWLKAAEAKIAELDVPQTAELNPYAGSGGAGYPGSDGGGSNFAGGFPGGPEFKLAASDPRGRMVSGGEIIISWSRDNNELRGFSNQRGVWTKLSVKKQEKIIPVVGGKVGAVRMDDMIAGYSGVTGQWGLLNLKPGSKAQPIVDDSLVQVVDGEHHYTFAASSGRWTSSTDPNFAIDDSVSQPAQHHAVDGSGPGVLPRGSRHADDPALKLARSLRDAKNVSDEQKASLKSLVEKSLQHRLAQQEQQVQQLKAKLKTIEESLNDRQQNKARIIERRVEELLNPNVEWESLAPPKKIPPYGIPSAGTPIGVPGPPHIPLGRPAGQSPPAESMFGRSSQSAASDTHSLSVTTIVDALITRQEVVEKAAAQVAIYHRAYSSEKTKPEGDINPFGRPRANEILGKISSEQRHLERSISVWNGAWRQYQSSVRFASLDVDQRKSELATIESRGKRLDELSSRGYAGSLEVEEAKSAVNLARVELSRATEQLEMLKSVPEDSPHLKPESFDVGDLLKPVSEEADEPTSRPSQS